MAMSMPGRQLRRLAEPISTMPSRPAKRSRLRPRLMALDLAVTWLRLWAAAFLVTAGWMTLQAAIIVTGSDLVQARDVLARTVRAGDELELELASMRSMARIEAAASERLGLTRPGVKHPVAAAVGHVVTASAAPSDRTVTLLLPSDAGIAGVKADMRPRPRLGAWDTFLNWLTGRATEAATRD